MKKAAITDALKLRLQTHNTTMTGKWPNVATQGATERPYFLVEFPVVGRTGGSLKGTAKRELGVMMVTVVTTAHTNNHAVAGEDYANDLADEIEKLFPQALRMPIQDGLVTIMQPADIRAGYKDGPDWRVPVAIQYSANKQ